MNWAGVGRNDSEEFLSSREMLRVLLTAHDKRQMSFHDLTFKLRNAWLKPCCTPETLRLFGNMKPDIGTQSEPVKVRRLFPV